MSYVIACLFHPVDDQTWAYTDTKGKGCRTSITDASGRTAWTYDLRDQVPVQSLEYTYDAVGNITQIRDHVAEIYPIEWQDQDFSYDDLNRLVSASATGSPAEGGYSESYTYDASTGNLSSKAGTSYTYGDTNHDHAVTQAGGNTYSYDANGNMTSRSVGGQSYTLGYDAEGHLISVNGATTGTFVYDGDGQRVISTMGTTTTGFVGDHTEWKVGAASQPTRYYNAGGMRLATRLDGVMYYPLTDHLGSTTMTTDASGNQVAEIRYKAWGESRYTDGTLPTKYTYTGQYSNVADFGLMYYNARWYDNALGRFTSADSIVPQPGNPQAWDRYTYTSNNPVNFTDPSGHMAVEGCGDEGKSACTPTEQELAAYEYWSQRQQHQQCHNGKSLFCSPFEKIPKELEKIDKDLSMDLIEELELPQYQSLLENKYTPVVFGGISVLATDTMYVSMILVPKSSIFFPITVGASYLTARLSGIVSSISTGYQYDHNMYGTTENDVKISAATTIISAWPKPDMGFVNHIGFLYTFSRTFGLIGSP